MIKQDIKTFHSLNFFPISNFTEGCVAQTKLTNCGHTITVWGGGTGQKSDGATTFDVKVTNNKDKLVRPILKEQSQYDITGLMDHLQRYKPRRRTQFFGRRLPLNKNKLKY